MYLLFDFDGTLVNSFDCVMAKTILLAQEYGFRKIQPDEIEALRDLSSKEIVKFLKVPLYKIPMLIARMRKHLRDEMAHLLPVEGLQEILEKLYQEKHLMGILTSNSKENVESWLNINRVRHFFHFVHTESNYFSKKYLIRKTLSKYKIDKSQAIYICDETRDIEAAQKNQISSIGVSWGYNSAKAISKSSPSFLVKEPREILACIADFQGRT